MRTLIIAIAMAAGTAVADVSAASGAPANGAAISEAANSLRLTENVDCRTRYHCHVGFCHRCERVSPYIFHPQSSYQALRAFGSGTPTRLCMPQFVPSCPGGRMPVCVQSTPCAYFNQQASICDGWACKRM